MADCVFQVKVILRVYLERGEKALAELEAGHIDQGNVWLQRRTAAFHNLRVTEALLPSASLAILSDDPDIVALWSEIRRVDSRLAVAIKAAHAKTAALMLTLQAAKQKISSYRSGEPELSRFERSA